MVYFSGKGFKRYLLYKCDDRLVTTRGVLFDVLKGFEFLEVSANDPQVCDRGRRWYKGVVR